MEKKIRLGHIGTKHDHSYAKLECAFKYPEVFEFVGIVEEDPEQWEKVKNYPLYTKMPHMTLTELFDAGVDAVLIESFELDIPHYAYECAKRGIAMHVDKPAGDDLNTFVETLRICKKNKIPLQMAYIYRCNPFVRDCLELYRAGELGEIHSVTAIMNTGHDAAKRKWLECFPAGDFFFLGCHMVDFAYMFMGVPEKITSYLRPSGFDGNKCIDMGTCIFEYKNGLAFLQANSVEINGHGRRQLVVCGTKGSYEIYPLEGATVARFTSKEKQVSSYRNCATVRDIKPLAGNERYDGLIEEFIDMIRKGVDNTYSYEYELKLQQLVLASCGYGNDYKENIEI